MKKMEKYQILQHIKYMSNENTPFAIITDVIWQTFQIFTHTIFLVINTFPDLTLLSWALQILQQHLEIFHLHYFIVE